MAKINGQEAPVLLIKGKEYPTVATRVQLAHNGVMGAGFSMVRNDVVSIGDRHFVRITIEIERHAFSGTAEIHFNATGNTADATSPLETAETSALGRALAFAGYMIDTIASADEMERAGHTFVEAEAPRHLPKQAPSLPPPSAVPTIAEQCATLAKSLNYSHDGFLDLCHQHKMNGKPNYDAVKAQLLKESVEKDEADRRLIQRQVTEQQEASA